MRWQEVTLRLALIYGLLAAIAYGVNVWIAAPLGLLAIAATAELAIRPYAADLVDRLLLGCGAVVTTLILTGLALNLTPWGLTRITSAVTWTILSIGVLAWRKGLGTGMGRSAGGIRSFGPWVFSASMILVAAAVLSLAGVRQWDRQPVLAFALASTGPNAVVVEIDSTAVDQKFRIVATSKAPGARQYLGPTLIVKSGSDAARVFERVPVNIAGVWTIELRSANNDATARRLIVDVH